MRLAGLLFCLLASACLPALETRQCRSDDDCAGATCSNGTCVAVQPSKDAAISGDASIMDATTPDVPANDALAEDADSPDAEPPDVSTPDPDAGDSRDSAPLNTGEPDGGLFNPDADLDAAIDAAIDAGFGDAIAPFNYSPSNVGQNFRPSSAIFAPQNGCEIVTPPDTFNPPAMNAACGSQAGIGYSVAAGDIPVLHVGSLEIGTSVLVRVRGRRPLIFVVYGEATIDGTIDIAARGTSSGPGGDEFNCVLDGAGMSGSWFNGSGAGGGGGGFGGAGGGGAIGGGGGIQTPGGDAQLDRDLVPLNGGCGGGFGGSAVVPTAGGGAGGALQISAARQLRLSGEIFATGGGGQIAAESSGGGGGGSGGGVLLEADDLRLSSGGEVDLRGGGGSGGGGAPMLSSEVGEDGIDGGEGGAGAVGGGAGGDGGAAVANGSNGLPGVGSGYAGGGGGGGAGILVRYGRNNCVNLSQVRGVNVRRLDPTNSCN